MFYVLVISASCHSTLKLRVMNTWKANELFFHKYIHDWLNKLENTTFRIIEAEPHTPVYNIQAL